MKFPSLPFEVIIVGKAKGKTQTKKTLRVSVALSPGIQILGPTVRFESGYLSY